jgi:hypothetical protein
MMTPLRRLIGTVAASVMLVVGAGLPAQAQVEVGDGLVNIVIGDVTILEDVNVAVAANIAAQVCGIVVNVGVIQEIDADGGTFECDFRRGPQDITITQNA